MPPMEIITSHPTPVPPIVIASPRRSGEGIAIDSSGMMRVHRDIVHIILLIKNGCPMLTSVFGQKNTSGPTRHIHALWVRRIDRHTSRKECIVFRQYHLRPAAGSIGRFINSAAKARTRAGNKIKITITGNGYPERTGIITDAFVLQHPGLPVIHRPEHSLIIYGGIQRTISSGRSCIHCNTGDRGMVIHPFLQRGPGPAAICRNTNASSAMCLPLRVACHFVSRQIVYPRPCRPKFSCICRVEHNPVAGIHPVGRHSRHGSDPGLSTIE